MPETHKRGSHTHILVPEVDSDERGGLLTPRTVISNQGCKGIDCLIKDFQETLIKTQFSLPPPSMGTSLTPLSSHSLRPVLGMICRADMAIALFGPICVGELLIASKRTGWNRAYKVVTQLPNWYGCISMG